MVDKFRLKLNKSPFRINRPIPTQHMTPSIGYTSNISGRLGNQMFIYAYVRLLAEAENRPFKLKSDKLKALFNTTEKSLIDTTNYERPIGSEFYQDNNNLDLLLKHRDKVREWFQLPIIGNTILSERGYPTIIHVRGTDFLSIGRKLPKSYYYNAMSGKKNFLVVTDDVNYAKSLFQLKYEIISSPNDLSIIYHAKDIIASHSTFCWWGIFLGISKPVIVPANDGIDDCWKPTNWGIKNLGWISIHG